MRRSSWKSRTARIRLMMAGNQNWRMIDLDGRPQTAFRTEMPRIRCITGMRSGNGKAMLVVDTKGFHDRFWFSNGGSPHPACHLIEALRAPICIPCDTSDDRRPGGPNLVSS